MPNAKGKVTVGTVVDESLRDRLDERAGLEKRSRSEVVERACLFYLEFAEVERKGEIPKIKGATGFHPSGRARVEEPTPPAPRPRKSRDS